MSRKQRAAVSTVEVGVVAAWACIMGPLSAIAVAVVVGLVRAL